MWTVVAALSLVIWAVLMLARGGFWRFAATAVPPPPAAWPAVVAVVPARDEAATIGRCVAAILDQDYPGDLRLVVVDDGSSDGTATAAGRAARLSVIAARPLPSGWTGKVWAMDQGVRAAGDACEFIWFTDADIVHAPGTLRRLVARAEGERRDLVSEMVRLRCVGFWERLLVPAFVFFFAKLYPFARVADARRPTAAAAGGSMLARRRSLERAGGLAAIGGAWIDDCALAAAMKRAGGRLWLGLGETSGSLRAYPDLASFWAMVARTAYVELRRSPPRLLGAVAGMILVYLAPVAAVVLWPLHGDGAAAVLGALAVAAMVLAYAPILRFHRLPAAWAATLPLAAALYTAMTVDSARRHHFAGGPQWKGRAPEGAAPAP
ncbi:MAG: glycosyltransferase [Alphaproteobacteria bacterium]|nr:glycosyltransferase [Alphaproteobacteria bacterium]